MMHSTLVSVRPLVVQFSGFIDPEKLKEYKEIARELGSELILTPTEKVEINPPKIQYINLNN